MRKKKIMFDAFFIVLSGLILIVLNEYGLVEKHIEYALIPVLIAYYLGQFVERKIKTKTK